MEKVNKKALFNYAWAIVKNASKVVKFAEALKKAWKKFKQNLQDTAKIAEAADEYVTQFAEFFGETEKAVRLKIKVGYFNGLSDTERKVLFWFPKSLIKEEGKKTGNGLDFWKINTNFFYRKLNEEGYNALEF